MNRVRKIHGAKQGSALLAALCFCAVLGIALASYMGVCSQTMKLSNRNSQGTRSLELAETGMEDALWALNKNDWIGWTVDNGSSPHVATKTLSDFAFGNGVTGSAVISIENYDGVSTLPAYAQGLRTLKVSGQTFLADGTTVTRKFEASAERAPLFVNALAAVAASTDSGNGRSGVTFTGAGSVDSFDSVRTGIYGDLDGDGIANGEDDDMDGDGLTNDVDDDDDGDGLPDILDSNLYGSGFGYSAVVSSTTSVSLTNAQISGYVATAATQSGDPRISYAYSARIAGPTTSMSTSIDSSRLSTSPYQPTFEIKTPAAAGSTFPALPTATATASIGDSSGATTTYYSVGDLVLTGSQVLTVNGPVVVVVSGNFKIQDSAEIIVTNLTNAAGEITGRSSLQVILTGSTSELSIGGNGITNQTKRPKNVAILDGASSSYYGPEITTTKDFYGVIYVPNCASEFTVSSNLEFYGSLVAKTITITGSPKIHYDVDLRRVTTQFSGIDTPFGISSWKETTP